MPEMTQRARRQNDPFYMTADFTISTSTQNFIKIMCAPMFWKTNKNQPKYTSLPLSANILFTIVYIPKSTIGELNCQHHVKQVKKSDYSVWYSDHSPGIKLSRWTGVCLSASSSLPAEHLGRLLLIEHWPWHRSPQSTKMPMQRQTGR